MNDKSDDHVSEKVEKKEQKEEEDEIAPCRICLSNEMPGPTNPLINPCKCKGT